jgi:DNA-directed RNA polymerase subunit RPC12/RpoP
MAMVCPQCAISYEQRLQCPSCGVRLLYDFRGPKPKTQALPRWQQTPWGRILIGLVLAQGLYYGLQHLLTGLLEALNGQGLLHWTWTSLSGLVFLQIVQVVALTAGAVLAGGGQPRGATLGALVGVWNGVLSVLLDPILHPDFVPTLTTLTLVGVPLVHIAFGAMGGWIGYSIWRPVRPTLAAKATPLVRNRGVARLRAPLFSGRVAWFRVALGALFAAAGYLTATMVFNFIIDFSSGKLASDGFWQDRVVTWEIQALAVLVGGGLAGYNTANGLKQGMWVGLAASMLLLCVLFGLSRLTPEQAALTVVCCFCLCLAGGWFGSQLFPPVLEFKSRRLGPASLP